jgi:two-component system cell cycle response regulator
MLHQKTILIIDDDDANLTLLTAMLEIGGYNAIKAANGPQGLAALRIYRVDSILLDVMMPGMDGYQVCRTIKTNPALAAIPVVMLTALYDEASRSRAFASGADAFLAKPVAFDTLTRQLEDCKLQAVDA